MCVAPAASSALAAATASLGIDLVGRAQAGELRARRLERGDHLVAAGEAVVGHRLDAAGLEEILGERRARGEIGGAAEIGEKDFRAARRLSPARGRTRRATLRTARPGGWRGSAAKVRPATGLAAARRGATSRTATGVSARSGNSLVPVSASLRRAIAASRSARTAATLRWIRPRFERRRRAAGRFDLLEQRPGGAAELRRSSLRCRRSRRPDRRPWRDWIPRAA